MAGRRDLLEPRDVGPFKRWVESKEPTFPIRDSSHHSHQLFQIKIGDDWVPLYRDKNSKISVEKRMLFLVEEFLSQREQNPGKKNWRRAEPRNIDSMIRMAGEFGDYLSPDRSPRNALYKIALEEIPELLQNMEDPLELADIVILAFDIAYKKNWDLAGAFYEKMEINWDRSWEQDSETGIFKHK